MDLGRVLIAIGVFFIVAGLFVLFRDQIPWLKNLGRLPGDIAVERENYSFYFPIMTSLILSLVLSLIAYLLRR